MNRNFIFPFGNAEAFDGCNKTLSDEHNRPDIDSRIHESVSFPNPATAGTRIGMQSMESGIVDSKKHDIDFPCSNLEQQNPTNAAMLLQSSEPAVLLPVVQDRTIEGRQDSSFSYEKTKGQKKAKKKNARPCICKICSSVLACASNLRRHIRIHTRNTRYTCRFCGCTFTDSTNHKRHEYACNESVQRKNQVLQETYMPQSSSITKQVSTSTEIDHYSNAIDNLGQQIMIHHGQYYDHHSSVVKSSNEYTCDDALQCILSNRSNLCGQEMQHPSLVAQPSNFFGGTAAEATKPYAHDRSTNFQYNGDANSSRFANFVQHVQTCQSTSMMRDPLPISIKETQLNRFSPTDVNKSINSTSFDETIRMVAIKNIITQARPKPGQSLGWPDHEWKAFPPTSARFQGDSNIIFGSPDTLGTKPYPSNGIQEEQVFAGSSTNWDRTATQKVSLLSSSLIPERKFQPSPNLSTSAPLRYIVSESPKFGAYHQPYTGFSATNIGQKHSTLIQKHSGQSLGGCVLPGSGQPSGLFRTQSIISPHKNRDFIPQTASDNNEHLLLLNDRNALTNSAGISRESIFTFASPKVDVSDEHDWQLPCKGIALSTWPLILPPKTSRSCASAQATHLDHGLQIQSNAQLVRDSINRLDTPAFLSVEAAESCIPIFQSRENFYHHIVGKTTSHSTWNGFLGCDIISQGGGNESTGGPIPSSFPSPTTANRSTNAVPTQSTRHYGSAKQTLWATDDEIRAHSQGIQNKVILQRDHLSMEGLLKRNQLHKDQILQINPSNLQLRGLISESEIDHEIKMSSCINSTISESNKPPSTLCNIYNTGDQAQVDLNEDIEDILSSLIPTISAPSHNNHSNTGPGIGTFHGTAWHNDLSNDEAILDLVDHVLGS